MERSGWSRLKKLRLEVKIKNLGFSVTSASLHSQKIPRGILAVNSNKTHQFKMIILELMGFLPAVL